ncbi:hypothetical protein SVAN01_10282 [Stagonosporopsis vannaccii]|nr:hypothetical protein SVAN01_10282 [Stagonosporopsis vannaccii]
MRELQPPRECLDDGTRLSLSLNEAKLQAARPDGTPARSAVQQPWPSTPRHGSVLRHQSKPPGAVAKCGYACTSSNVGACMVAAVAHSDEQLGTDHAPGPFAGASCLSGTEPQSETVPGRAMARSSLRNNRRLADRSTTYGLAAIVEHTQPSPTKSPTRATNVSARP